MENSGKQNPETGFKSPSEQREKFSKVQSTTDLIDFRPEKPVFPPSMPWERSIGKASASTLKIYSKKDGRYDVPWYVHAGRRHVSTRNKLAAAKSFQAQKIAELQRHRETNFDLDDRGPELDMHFSVGGQPESLSRVSQLPFLPRRSDTQRRLVDVKPVLEQSISGLLKKSNPSRVDPPHDWQIIQQQYDQMIKYATASRLGTARRRRF